MLSMSQEIVDLSFLLIEIKFLKNLDFDIIINNFVF